MKKFFLLVSALVLAVACAAPPTNKEIVSNPGSTPGPVAPAMTEADAIAKEKSVWDVIKSKDYVAFADLLATDWIEVLPEGVTDKAGSIEGVKPFEPSEITFSEWKFLQIDKDAFVISYTVAAKGKFAGKELPSGATHASSAWVYRDKKWVAIYHQECPVVPARAQSANAPAKPVASPAAKPAVAEPGPDAVANEKGVWELFINKDYDTFAARLATDFLEVTPDGFYDKAGSVKGVTMFDASKSELSEWKTAKLDDDATLVTYLVKDPRYAPNGERHATIWVKRDGKWMGLFHHGGTPARKAVPSPPAAASPAAAAATPAEKKSPVTP